MVPGRALAGLVVDRTEFGRLDGWFGSISPNGPVMKVSFREPSAFIVAKMSPWMFGRE